MGLIKILSSAIIGTSAMTLFSYIISQSKNKNFLEPELVSQLVKRLPKSYTGTQADIAGWTAHYAIGVLFVAIYTKTWAVMKIKPSVSSGAILGTLSGVVGVVGWHCMFKLHPAPPPKNRKQYYEQLIIAHTVFGIFSALTCKLLQSNTTDD
ncbi:MAG: hypothetical protein ABIV51_05930 [Saprospiraceae bacterium]